MNKFQCITILTLLVAIAVVGCGDTNKNITTNAVKPLVVQLATVQPSAEHESFTFPARVRAMRHVDIAFQVSGKIEKLNLVEGKDIKQGTLLASLDQGPFLRNLRQSEVRRDQALNELNRIKSLIAKNIASQQDLDNAQASFDLAQIEWENRKADLNYSKLTAPFNATVAKRYVEKGSYVGVGKTIVSLQDESQIYFEIQVPERLVARYQGQGVPFAKAYVSGFERRFDVVYAEHNTQPDPTTQTYKVVYSMPQPADLNIATGINASIEVKAPTASESTILIPLTALVAEPDNQFSVWLYNAQTSTVAKTEVKVGSINGQRVPVISGLASGDQIVVAGINKMRNNLAVMPYKGE